PVRRAARIDPMIALRQQYYWHEGPVAFRQTGIYGERLRTLLRSPRLAQSRREDVNPQIRPARSSYTSKLPGARDTRRDRELLAALAAGSPQALAELYERHVDPLFRHAFVLTRNRSDAEDLVQGVFLKLAGTG